MGLRAGYHKDPKEFGYDYFSPQKGFHFRAPVVDFDRPYGVCVGAAQTFGRFSPNPFPCLVSRRLGMQVLNMGIGGAGPEDFIDPYPLSIMKNAEFVVLQALSARSIDCAWYKHNGSVCYWRATNKRIKVVEAWKRIVEMGEEEAVIGEVRARWLSAYRLLLSNCPEKTIALWMARRGSKIDMLPSDGNLMEAMCSFPQFVSPQNWRTLKSWVWNTVEVATTRPITFDPPIVLPGAKNPTAIDYYYPDQKAHHDVAERIATLLEEKET